MSTNENTQNDFDPHAIPLCESCGSSACCRSEGERAATERIIGIIERQPTWQKFGADVINRNDLLVEIRGGQHE